MFRSLLLAAALLVAPPAAAAPKAKPPVHADWLHSFAATPAGGFRIGNVNAPVKLIEYASLTCPHCRHFHETGMAALRSKYIATGKVSYEYRSFVLNGPDFAASLIARCDGASAFFARVNLLYSTQEQWTAPFAALTPDDTAKLAALEPDAQIGGMAKLGGLDTFMAAHGMSADHVAQCLSNKAARDKLSAMASTVGTLGIHSTPSFLIDGAVAADANTWEQVEPLIVAALRKRPPNG